MSVEIRYARYRDYGRISNFLDKFWQQDHIYCRKPELFDWAFGRRDLWNDDGYSFALMEERGELVGILGAIPFNFNCLGHTLPAVWFANYMIRQDYRRGPLGMRLLGAFDAFPVRTVFGMNPRVVPIYQRLGWRIVPPIPRHFLVLPNAIDRASRVIRLAQPKYPPNDAEALAEFFSPGRLSPISMTLNRAIPSDWDANHWSEVATRTIGASRDSSYLRWRYQEHPCFKYRIIVISENQRAGLAIWRLETIRELTTKGLDDVDVIARLVEFIPASRENAEHLLAAFFRDISEAGAFGADYYGYHSHSRAWLHELGFKTVDSHHDGGLIPSRFQPLEPAYRGIIGAVIGDLPSHPEAENCLWYWTKSDADQDRPN
jgi:hypothetical protein